MHKRVLLIGGGRMGRAMVQGMIDGGVLAADHLEVVDRNAGSRDWWQSTYPQATVTPRFTAPPDAAGASDTVVILAIKPGHLQAFLQQAVQLAAPFWSHSLVISVAAGVSLAQLSKWLRSRRVVRVMPNTPALVGAGASGYCCGEGVNESDQLRVREILEAFGTVAEVPEYQIDAVTGVSGSGPAYVFMFIEAMADGGVLAGLPRATAMQLAVQTVLGAAKMVAETGQHPGELKDAVASPGGTTIAAIRTLEHNGFRGAVMDAVMASANRSRELGSS